MGTSNSAESTISSFRRMPFIAADEPRDVPDLPIQDEAAPRPAEAAAPAPEVGSPNFVGPPPPPPQKARTKLGVYWHWGLIGCGVMAAAGFGGLKLYQNWPTPAPAAVATSPRPALNSSTALGEPRNAATRPPQAPAAAPAAKAPAPAPSEAPPQAPAAGPAPAKLEAPARLEGPPTGPQPAVQPQAASDPAAGSAPPSNPSPSNASPSNASRTSTAETVTDGRKIVALPMMGDEQRQVLDLVAATSSAVLQVKRQVDDDGKKMREMQAQLDDMKRMVSLSQAKLLSAATQIALGNMQAAPPAPPTPGAPPAAGPQPTTGLPPAAAETPDIGPACRLRPSYVVASASPAHATLKNGGQVFISVRAPSRDTPQGDSIPCYGHVLKITQEGSRWVVMTERDVIGRN